MAALLHISDRECRAPDLDILPDGRKRLTRYLTLGNKLQIPPELDFAYGTLDVFTAPVGWDEVRLTAKKITDDVPAPGRDSRPILQLVYEQISLTDETPVGGVTRAQLEDGRQSLEENFIQFSTAAYAPQTPGTVRPYDASSFLLKEVAPDDGTVRRITRTYVSAGILATDDEQLQGGALLKRTITSAVTVPATPTGYTLVGTPVQNPNGLPIYTYTYYKGSGEAGRETDYFQSSTEGTTGGTRVTITFLTALTVNSDPTSAPAAGYARAMVKKDDSDGHRIWTVIWANGTGLVISTDELKNGGKLVLYHRVTFGSAPSAPSPTISGTVAATSSGFREDAGYRIYDYTWAEGVGEISRGNEYRLSADGGVTGLTVTTVRYLSALTVTTNPIAVPSGFATVQDTHEDADGHRIWLAIFAKGTGTVISNVDQRIPGKLVIYSKTAMNAAPDAPSPTIIGTVILTKSGTRRDRFHEGCVIYDYEWAEGLGETSRSTSQDNGGALQRVVIGYLTAATVDTQPTTDPLSGGVAIVTGKRDEAGYRLWEVTWAKGLGAVVDSSELQNNGKLTRRRIIALGQIPSTPSGFAVVGSASRAEAGHVVYTYEFAQGVGRIRTETQQHNGGKLLMTDVTYMGSDDSTGISAIVVTSGGSGYTSTPAVTITGGGGTGATATATLSSGGVTGVTLSAGGSGYTSVPTVTFTGGGGFGAAATAVLSPTTVASGTIVAGGSFADVPTVTLVGGGGSGAAMTAALTPTTVASIAVTNSGTGYTSTPTVTISGGGGTGATATAALSAGVIGGLTLTNGGSGYTSAPTVAITGGGGTGAAATATLAGTSVVSATLTAAGSGYTSTPTVAVTGGSGSGATLTAALTPTTVASLTVTNIGAGYTTGNPTVTISGGGGSGATATPVMTGSVSGMTLTNGGSGYTSNFTVTFTGGGGSGASAAAIVVGGAVVGFYVDNEGINYTSAPTPDFSAGSGTGCAATVAMYGGVRQVQMVYAGSGYASAPAVVFTGGGGSGATAGVIMSGTQVLYAYIINCGTGYSSIPIISFTGGGGAGATANAWCSLTRWVSSVTLTAAGSGYTSTPTVTVSGGSGSGTTVAATLTGTTVASLAVGSGGINYTSTPTVTISGGGGSGATGTAALAGSSVSAINLTYGGSGYTSAPSVGFSGGGGSGASATAQITLNVASVTVTNAGSGYTSVPSVTLTGGGASSGATAVARLTATTVASLTVTSGGSGYTSAPTIGFTGGYGATATANMTPVAIASLALTSAGSGYTSAPTVGFTGGGGSSATATASVNISVVGVTVTNPGSNYTSAPTVGFTGGGGTGAAAGAFLAAVPPGTKWFTSSQQEAGYTLTTDRYAHGSGVYAQRRQPREGGLALVTWESFSENWDSSLQPSGILYTKDFTLLDGTTHWAVACMQLVDGTADPASKTALTNTDKHPFTYPGRAKTIQTDLAVVITGTAVTVNIFDVYRSPPVTLPIDATVKVTYQTSGTLGTLDFPQWAPDNWATIYAYFIAWNQYPKAIIESLPGYRSVSETPKTFNGGAIWTNGYLQSCLGERVYALGGGAPYSLATKGGPAAPDGNTYTLYAKVEEEPAFVAYDGTKYYRKTQIYATIPTQTALPV